MTCKYKWVTYEWYTRTYEWHTDDIRVLTSDTGVTFGLHTSTYEWHTNGMRVHTTDIQMACEWYANDIRYFKQCKGSRAFRL